MKILTKKQNNHSKMKDLRYTEIKMQSYLKSPNLKINQKRSLFKWRTRMERFGENYRGGGESVMCPLCGIHVDSQNMSIQCPEISQEFPVKEDISDDYKLSLDTIDTIMRIIHTRQKPLMFCSSLCPI